MLALVSPSISSARLIATAARWAIARAISASSSLNARAAGEAGAQHPDPLAAGGQRRDQQVGDLRAGHSAAAPAGRAPPSSAASISSAADGVAGGGSARGTRPAAAALSPSASSR